MFRVVRFRREKEAAFQVAQLKRVADAQPWLVLAAGATYAAIGLWTGAGLDERSGLTTASVVLLLATMTLWGATFTPFLRARADLVPVILALLVGWHTLFTLVYIPTHGMTVDAPLRAAFLFGSLAIVLALISPTVQVTLAAMATAGILAGLGFGVVFPLQNIDIAPTAAMAFAAPLVALGIGIAYAIERTRREGFSYKHELSRRSSTDDISGVSNRAHIHQLAQNEFSRARRYKEPLSIVMLEIDGYDSIQENAGPIALDTLIQVFAGYCVVVMRHCDSFGRLGPKRFMAILPETPAKGAMVVATRMCRDLAALDVLVEGDTLNFTVTIGVAQAHQNDKWGGDLMRRAAQAIDDGIEQGRNMVILSQMPEQPAANDEAPMFTGAAANVMMPAAAQMMSVAEAAPVEPQQVEPMEPEDADNPFGVSGGPGEGPQRMVG